MINAIWKIKACLAAIILVLIMAAGTDFLKAQGGDDKMDQAVLKSSKVYDLEDIRITIIYYNKSTLEGIKEAWGFSCLIEGLEKKILFDTGGDGGILLENIEKLGIEVSEIDIIIISHNHWDHVGGLDDVLRQYSDLDVCILPSFFSNIKDTIKSSGARLIEMDEPFEVIRGVHTTGKMGIEIEEQAIIINMDEGLMVITGCAHPGVENIAEKSKELLNREILLVLGGFHLREQSSHRIADVAKYMKKLGVKYVAPCHCSGENAFEVFREVFGENYLDVAGGKIVTYEDFQ
jgi:7,8-dihydropterin-6-yl-methyl-4-(beta-D-ribofuranosyl)aminobenzene 5'-phosphate synthase